MKTKYLFLVLGFLGFSQVYAQDAHFSNPIVLTSINSPASFSSDHAGFRIAGIYRNQWGAINAPYHQYGAQLSSDQGAFAWSLDVNQLQAGDNGISRTNVGFGGSYRHLLNGDNDHLVIGGRVGWYQKRIRPSEWIFGDQIDGAGQLIHGSATAEAFEQTTAGGLDLSVGLGWNGTLAEKVKARFNVGLFHPNQPNMSFLGNPDVRLPNRTQATAQLDFQMDALLSLAPYVIYQQQGPARSFTAGSFGRYQFQDQRFLHYGIGYRWNDALLLHGGMELKQTQFFLAYDLNTSGLRQAASTNGAIELGIVVHLQKGKTSKKTWIDTDLDGLHDGVDHCPTIYGSINNQGCPDPTKVDSDQDGLADEYDECPQTPGILALRGCPEYRNTDSDQDGVPDYLDLCPYVAGSKTYQGCSDSDNDGIWDMNDACPKIYGSKENNGCPQQVLDSDNDGIINEMDQCPYIAGSIALNGCPDSDSDGLNDLEDACPFFKGPVSNNGCPIKSSDMLEDARKALIVEYDIDQSFIKPQYYMDLIEVVQHLHQHPHVLVILSGHTDSEGSNTYNYALSERRTNGVRTFLMDHGIEAERIQSYAYGEDRPKRGNQTNFGKARNRRTELYIK
ncbi:MAG: PorP/SprF family type IX secretion system membrane protein [Bacteroidota bacterium]